jgi:hypothetical protein
MLYQAASYGPGSCSVGKAMMEWRIRKTTGKMDGRFCGPPRAPGTAVADMEKLRADLAAIGFFDF